jgi:ribosomal protein L37AE/L43A
MKNDILESSFLVFWQTYPKKMAKVKAWNVWKKLKPNEDLFRLILEALAKHKQTEQWKSEKGKYIPYPASWLSQKRWEDELETVQENPCSFCGSVGVKWNYKKNRKIWYCQSCLDKANTTTAERKL